MQLTSRDRANLKGVHPDLVRVVERAAAITTIPFRVMEGVRSVAQQKKNIAKGVSWTMKSRHLTGHAVDLVPTVDINKDGKVSTDELYSWPLYYKLEPIIKKAAKDVGVPVEWGGDWKKNKDGPHWQLPWARYPVGAPIMPPPSASKAKKALAKIEEEMHEAPPPAEMTENRDAVEKTAATGTAGLTGATGVAVEPLSDAVSAVSGQQYELSSGDITRIVIAIGILALTGFIIWRTWRK